MSKLIQIAEAKKRSRALGLPACSKTGRLKALSKQNATASPPGSPQVTEANRLSRALGLSVRYSMSQDGKRDVWVEVYEARTLLKHGHSEEREHRGRAREWRDDLLDDPAEAAVLSAVRNVDAVDPGKLVNDNRVHIVQRCTKAEIWVNPQAKHCLHQLNRSAVRSATWTTEVTP
jgi:hypothetical protein